MDQLKSKTEPTNENEIQQPAARGQSIMADKQDFGYEQTLVSTMNQY